MEALIKLADIFQTQATTDLPPAATETATAAPSLRVPTGETTGAPSPRVATIETTGNLATKVQTGKGMPETTN